MRRARGARGAGAGGRPRRRNRAGPRTTQTSAQPSTTTPAATPVRPHERVPVTTRPAIETSTMPAAVSAASPALAFARRAASSGECPARKSLLLARGEQECIVDARADPEHAGERRREPRDRRDGRGPEQDREAEADAREGDQQRVAGGARRCAAPRAAGSTATTRPATSPIGKPPVAEPSNTSPANDGLPRRAGSDLRRRSRSSPPRRCRARPRGRRRCTAAAAVCPSGAISAWSTPAHVWLAFDGGDHLVDGPVAEAHAGEPRRSPPRPPGRGSADSRRSWARWDSMPGTVKSSSKPPPAAIAPAVSATTARRTSAVIRRGARPSTRSDGGEHARHSNHD